MSDVLTMRGITMLVLIILIFVIAVVGLLGTVTIARGPVTKVVDAATTSVDILDQYVRRAAERQRKRHEIEDEARERELLIEASRTQQKIESELAKKYANDPAGRQRFDQIYAELEAALNPPDDTSAGNDLVSEAPPANPSSAIVSFEDPFADRPEDAYGGEWRLIRRRESIDSLQHKHGSEQVVTGSFSRSPAASPSSAPGNPNANASPMPLTPPLAIAQPTIEGARGSTIAPHHISTPSTRLANISSSRTRGEETPGEGDIELAVTARQIPALYHFTRTSNLKSILTYGLVSVSKAAQLGVTSTNNDKMRLDGHLDAASLSIGFPNDRMFHKIRQTEPNERWVVLAIDPAVLWLKECAFCQRNAADHRLRQRPKAALMDARAFQSMFEEMEGLRSRAEQSLLDCDPTDQQAEVLVFATIEPKWITAITFDNHASRDSHAALLGSRDVGVSLHGQGLFGARLSARKPRAFH